MQNFAMTLVFLLGAAACGDDGVDSDEEARRAYLGLDQSIGKSIKLGFDGFNAASSANIDPQMTTGTTAGTLVITGQADQGASPNKTMRLRVGMVDYTDGVIDLADEEDIEIIYDTDADMATQPYLEMKLQNIPTGTLSGTLTGTYHMDGDIIGDVTLNVMFNGQLMDLGNMDVGRVPGSTTVTGTATNPDGGTYDISLML